MQSLASRRWAVRTRSRSTPAGNIRMLDAVEQRLAQGEAVARSRDVPAPRGGGLPGGPQRPGAVARRPRPGARPPGGRPVAGTARGSPPSARPSAARRTSRARTGAASSSTAAGRTGIPPSRSTRWPATSASAVGSNLAPVVIGGPEDLLDLADLGVLGDEPTRLAVDVRRPPRSRHRPLCSPTGSRRRNAISVACTTARRRPRPRRASPDGQPDPRLPATRSATRWSTTARYDGARSVTASSSMSDATRPARSSRGEQPYAAVDGDPASVWVANYARGPERLVAGRVRGARPVGSVTVTAGPDSAELVRVRTSARSSRGSRSPPVPPGWSRSATRTRAGCASRTRRGAPGTGWRSRRWRCPG